MKKDEVKTILNTQSLPYLYMLDSMVKYVLSPEVKPVIVNYVVKEARARKNNISSSYMLQLFYSAIRPIISNTVLCKNQQNEQLFASAIWEKSQLNTLVISMLRSNSPLLPVSKEEKETLTKEQRLAKQAALMRAAKERKRQERLREEQRQKAAKTNQNKVPVVKQQSQAPTNQEKRKISKEDLERIEFLRNL